MPTVTGVRLRYAGKTLFFDPGELELAEGDRVIVSTARGEEFGMVAFGPREVDASEIVDKLKPVLRVATEDDERAFEELCAREDEARLTFRRLVNQHKLDMKPLHVEAMFDGNKMVFYFSAEERIDFRDLVRDLASEFRTRIEMRQVGVRDEARMIGGIAHCGQQLCCSRFGGDFQPVSIRMAKEQDLPLNPVKISGVCGRLMCCLRYEFEAYKDFKGRAPRKGATIELPDGGTGRVVDLDTPREVVTLGTEQGRIKVPLAAMDCSSDKGCPCRVRAEALAEHDVKMGSKAAVGVVASAVAAESQQDKDDRAGRAEAAAAAATGEAGGAKRSRRSRRRGKGGGKGEGGEGQAAAQTGGQATGTAQAPQAGGSAPQPKQERQQTQQPGQPRPKPAQTGPAEGTAPSTGSPATGSGRRRRRRHESS
jgi:cell fate regulator YaaT (PSP1 superfamily)